ncbi:hypothetical protein, partial [Pseudomarimonas arenosa]|uniref:hypothetical protein n=1 Tax=Pseudomarimonas arenosa TaxID=2774145 RepID=UPI001CDB7D9B
NAICAPPLTPTTARKTSTTACRSDRLPTPALELASAFPPPSNTTPAPHHRPTTSAAIKCLALRSTANRRSVRYEIDTYSPACDIEMENCQGSFQIV